MKCWKCGQELTDGTSVCVYCGVAQSRPTPVTEAGCAMRTLYDRYGAQAVLTSGTYLTNGLGDVMVDSKKLRNQLRMAIDAGVGRAYLEQLNIGAPDGDFDRRMRVLLTEEAGLSDKVAAELAGYFDEMIGWRAVSHPTRLISAPLWDADKEIITSDVGQIDERPYAGGRGYEENRYGEENEPGSKEYPSVAGLKKRLRGTKTIVAKGLRIEKQCNETFFIHMQKDTLMIMHIDHFYESWPMLISKKAIAEYRLIADDVEAMTKALRCGKVEMRWRGNGKFCCIHRLYLEDMPQLEQAGVVQFVDLDDQKRPEQYEAKFYRNGDVFAAQLKQKGFDLEQWF